MPLNLSPGEETFIRDGSGADDERAWAHKKSRMANGNWLRVVSGFRLNLQALGSVLFGVW